MLQLLRVRFNYILYKVGSDWECQLTRLVTSRVVK